MNNRKNNDESVIFVPRQRLKTAKTPPPPSALVSSSEAQDRGEGRDKRENGGAGGIRTLDTTFDRITV